MLSLPGATVRKREGRSLELAFDPVVTSAPTLIAQIAAAHAVEDVHIAATPIEEVIARFYDLHRASEA
jgi:ABC-2 type transport system ATP-binding protein